jgi:hypothetical protein
MNILLFAICMYVIIGVGLFVIEMVSVYFKAYQNRDSLRRDINDAFNIAITYPLLCLFAVSKYIFQKAEYLITSIGVNMVKYFDQINWPGTNSIIKFCERKNLKNVQYDSAYDEPHEEM